MADFGTILNPNNNTLDLYCNSITTNAPSKNDAYAILSSTTAAGSAPPGIPTLIDWSTSQLQAYKNVTISGGNTLFTLEKIGNYQVDLNVWLDLSTFPGSQNGVELLVNGTVITFDVAYSNGTTPYNYKGTLKAFVSKPSNAPVALSFSVSPTGFLGNFRYAQLSIIKME
jgi:hypothetical protein